MTAESAPPVVEPKKPVWKNPFLIAFVLGALVLTVLPFAQGRFLRAPPPGPPLGSWELRTLEGEPFGSKDLLGKVWIASFASDPGQQEEIGTILRHVEDLGDKVMLVSFVLTNGTGPTRPGGIKPRWLALTGTREQLDALVASHVRPAFVDFPHLRGAPEDAGTTLEEFAQVPTLGLVDQNGALRGFWTTSEIGRGNLINAARLLAKKGPAP